MASPSDCNLVDLVSELKTHLTEKIIPQLVSDGALGKDVSVVGQDIKPVGGYGEDHWMSHAFKIAVRAQDPGCSDTRAVHLFVKYQSNDPVWCDSAVSFRNEEVMYNQVVPFFEDLWAKGQDKQPLDIFAKCYRASAGSRSVVVMEDLTPKGFRLPSSQAALDGAHVFMALQRLGKLHALSYCAKVRRRTDFLSLAGALGDPCYGESHRGFQSGYLDVVLQRGLSRLAARGDGAVDAATVERLHHRLRSGRDESPAYKLMQDARSGEEPLAVIAHGDFCRNNLLFKYDEATGKPIDVRFVDLQNSKYCSPAVDLSFFLFLNTTAPQRSAHWDDMFVAYYDGLSTTMRSVLSTGSDPTQSPTMDMPSLASLRADFARHALYGFAICSFFLPVMHSTPGESPRTEDLVHLASEPDKFDVGRRVGAMFSHVGGQAADDTLADLLIEFIERGLVGQ